MRLGYSFTFLTSINLDTKIKNIETRKNHFFNDYSHHPILFQTV